MKNFYNTLCTKVLQMLLRAYLRRYNPAIVALIGFPKDTLIMDMTQAVLSQIRRVKVSRAKGMDALGETILGIRGVSRRKIELLLLSPYLFLRLLKKESQHPDMIMLSYDTGNMEETRELIAIARPQVAIIYAFLSGEAESEIKPDGIRVLESLTSDGYAIMNCDDQKVFSSRGRTRAKLMLFGFSDAADIRLMNYAERMDKHNVSSTSFKLRYGGSFVPVRFAGAYGKTSAYAASGAAGIGMTCGMHLVDIIEALNRVDFTKGGVWG